jgi:hypothetical protein
MIKKLIVLIAAVFSFTVIADYLGIINITVDKEKPKVLEIRDEYVLKSSINLDPNSL